MTAATTTLKTRNEAWGFYGTISHHVADPAKAFQFASIRIARATDGTPEGVRDFLDSRDGRHFADEVCNRMECDLKGIEHAIERAVIKYQEWRTCYADERKHGIPHGLPYLTGWVQHYTILAECA